jgi:hypothetical protein
MYRYMNFLGEMIDLCALQVRNNDVAYSTEFRHISFPDVNYVVIIIIIIVMRGS